MSDKKLLSIANISRELNIPESTLHYWKNRFAEYLPSVGKSRQKRFRSEAVEVFGTISEMLKLGHTTKDIKAHLASVFPINIDPQPDVTPVQQTTTVQTQAEGQIQIATAIGSEIAKAIGQQLTEVLSVSPVQGISPELEEQIRIASKAATLNTDIIKQLRDENVQLKNRLAVLEESGPKALPSGYEADEGLEDKIRTLEDELVRLRKDRRDMEKFLMRKINSLR